MPTIRQANTAHPDQMLDIYQHPGHLLRRAQQISVSIFYDEMGDELTPVQYAILNRAGRHPGIDQVSLAGLAAIDTSTGATVCARLEEKGLLERKVIPHNRRQRALTITREGQRLLDALEAGGPAPAPAPARAAERAGAGPVHGPAGALVRENNAQSRAPLALPAAGP
jgi:DNA-binding MarR family transcriptional regulator